MSNPDTRIVLVETAGELNLGSVARAMKNFGLKDLVLVNPQCDPDGPEAAKMAVHAKDVLQAAKRVGTLQEALAGCSRVAATTARAVKSPLPSNTLKTVLPWLYEIATPGALIFGPEERGLSTAELQWAQCWISIPTDAHYPTLNLAQAVALCCYEIFQYAPVKKSTSAADVTPAAVDAVEGYLQHMAKVLLEIGYLHPHTKTKRMEKLRKILHRSAPSKEELAMLRGIWSQFEWALAQPKGGLSASTTGDGRGSIA